MTRSLAKTVAVLAFFFLAYPLHAQDAICKKMDIPTNYIAVGELNSPECDDDANPFAMNAWILKPVSEGATVCVVPDYKIIGPKVAELVACESVQSDKCTPRLDGLPNAMVLRSPTECAKRKLPSNYKIHCSASDGLTDGWVGFMVGLVTSANCPPAPPANHTGHVSAANAWLAVKPDGATNTLAVCADDFNHGLNFIVRRFKDANCPENPYVAGSEQGLTGWILLLNTAPLKNQTLTVCQGFTDKSNKPYGKNQIQYHATMTYSELCGGPVNKPNSFPVYFRSDGTPRVVYPASCMVGNWYEVKNNAEWSFALTSSPITQQIILHVRRTDDSVSGDFSNSGAEWSGYLVWKNGGQLKNVVFTPIDDCSQIGTNQNWEYRR